MKPSITDNRKKRGRGRPATGIGKPVGLRLYPDLEKKIDGWAAKQSDKPGRPEAIRRLVEFALSGAGGNAPNKASARKIVRHKPSERPKGEKERANNGRDQEGKE